MKFVNEKVDLSIWFLTHCRIYLRNKSKLKVFLKIRNKSYLQGTFWEVNMIPLQGEGTATRRLHDTLMGLDILRLEFEGLKELLSFFSHETSL